MQSDQLDKKSGDSERFIQSIMEHLVAISSGRCAIDDDMILETFEENKLMAELLAGLKILHETIVFQKERLKRYARKIVEKQEEERKNLSRDIHDDLGQILAVVKMGLFSIKKELPETESVQKKYAVVEENVKRSLQALKMISSDLRGHEIKNVGLIGAMENLMEEYKKCSKISIDFTYSQKASKIKLEEQLEITVYRIFQESFTNVLKHARASRVWVALDCDSCFVYFEMRDDGQGMKKEDKNKRNSFGILGMHERISLFGGRLSISNSKEKGTGVHIKARFPLF